MSHLKLKQNMFTPSELTGWEHVTYYNSLVLELFEQCAGQLKEAKLMGVLNCVVFLFVLKKAY